jgi:predicted regulator of Ras-like GTPase activity (Roadblock/LC7/MglB family)
MNTEICIVALTNTLNEICNAYPEVKNTFIFRKDKKLIARYMNTDEATASSAVEAFSALQERANSTDCLESVTLQGTNRQLKIARVNSFYFATVASKEVDCKSLSFIMRVLLPTILKIVEAIQPEFAYVEIEPIDNGKESGKNIGETEVFSAVSNTREPATTNVEENERFHPEAPASQCMVENIGGFGNIVGSQDAVRIEGAMIEQWKTIYGDRKIEEVQVEETRTGKKMHFKLKPMKDSKLKGKGLIQMSEKAQLTLQTKKGSLVLVKPIIEQTKHEYLIAEKQDLNENVAAVFDDGVPNNRDEAGYLADLRENLSEIYKYEGVLGYILKNATTATIDLQDSSRTIEYAMLASEAFDSSEKLRKILELGNLESILIECKNIDLVCAFLGENKTSVFIKKNTNYGAILNKISF